MPYHVTKPGERQWSNVATVPGLQEAVLVGSDQGAMHLEIALCRLEPDTAVPPHLHAFEESWYVLSGSGSWAGGGLRYDIAAGDFGYAPVATAHEIRAGADRLEWLSVRAPRPPRLRTVPRAVRTHEIMADSSGRPDEGDPRHRLVGHFDETDLGPYGRISMPGYHGPNIRNISVRMLVDRLLGAQHHTLFMVEFAPRAGPGQAAKEHYHPFEEIYFLLSGRARGTLDGESVLVAAGDLVWLGVDSTHGFVNEGDEPVRWLEVQSPVPPDSDAFFFPDDWRELPAW